MIASLTVQAASGFDDPIVAPARWQAALERGATDTVFLTPGWQRAWWESFGRGALLLWAIERDGQLRAIAPLFADCGMVFFVGSGGSDYLDFIGDMDEAGLEAILPALREHVDGFLGCRFYHVPDRSPTGARLAAVCARLGWACYDEGDLPAPALDLAADPERARAATEKTSLVRHERGFRRDGALEVAHLRDAESIAEQLEPFFAQHVGRWAATSSPSLFVDPAQRAFYHRLAQHGAAAGWLRMTRVACNGAPIAFHFGASYRGSYLWYKPSFAIELARRSPGEVLLRQLLLAAIDEGAHTFDFGLGDEAFKQRFATRTERVRTWGVYPPGTGAQ